MPERVFEVRDIELSKLLEPNSPVQLRILSESGKDVVFHANGDILSDCAKAVRGPEGCFQERGPQALLQHSSGSGRPVDTDHLRAVPVLEVAAAGRADLHSADDARHDYLFFADFQLPVQ